MSPALAWLALGDTVGVNPPDWWAVHWIHARIIDDEPAMASMARHVRAQLVRRINDHAAHTPGAPVVESADITVRLLTNSDLAAALDRHYAPLVPYPEELPGNIAALVAWRTPTP